VYSPKPDTLPVNNKDTQPLLHYGALFAKLDVHEVEERCRVSFDGAAFKIRLLGLDRRVSFPAAIVEPEVKAAEKILLLRFLCAGKMRAHLGEFLSYTEIPGASVYTRQFEGRVLKRLAASQDANSAKKDECRVYEFLSSGEGGAKENALFVETRFYAADEDFAAQAQLRFSDNFPAAFTPEDMAFAGELLIERLSATVEDTR
jgi:hypothetical protein